MEGIMHTGQRNLIRIRVSHDAYDKGVRLKDFGEVIYGMYYGRILKRSR